MSPAASPTAPLPVLNYAPNLFLTPGVMNETRWQPTCGDFSLGFLHNQKAAGVSVRSLMHMIADRRGPRVIRTVHRPQRGGECDCGSELPHAPKAWLFSDRAPLCSSCRSLPWFTLLREPLSRVRTVPTYFA